MISSLRRRLDRLEQLVGDPSVPTWAEVLAAVEHRQPHVHACFRAKAHGEAPPAETREHALAADVIRRWDAANGYVMRSAGAMARERMYAMLAVHGREP